MQRHPRGAHDVLVASPWQPGRLLIGWSLGVLTTLGLLTATGGWYEYRQLSTSPASGAPDRHVTGQEATCEVEKERAVNIGGYEVVPDQPDGCYLRRPRIRPWQWADGIRDQLGRLSSTASAGPRADDVAGALMLRPPVDTRMHARWGGFGAALTSSPEYEVAARWYHVRAYRMS